MANFYKMVDTYRVVHANSPLHLHSENAPTKKDVLGPRYILPSSRPSPLAVSYL